MHTARYNFRLPEVGPVRFEIEMNKTGGIDVYEVSRKQWTKNPTEADPSAQPPLLELFMTRLQEYVPSSIHLILLVTLVGVYPGNSKSPTRTFLTPHASTPK